MRVLFFTTYTPNNDVFWGSLDCCGVEVVPQRYDDRPYGCHHEYVDLARGTSPDAIVCVGALDWGPGISNPIPRSPILRQLRDVAPTILLCGDVADSAWQGTLAEYEAAECFNLIVSMDGVERPGLLAKLTPIDVRPYAPKPWSQRRFPAGYTGGSGGEKHAVLQATRATSPGDAVPMARMAEFMCDCKVIVNAPRTGTGDADHVKGRVVETGFAGACLLERKNAATEQWFIPGVDYVEYVDSADASAKLQWIEQNDAAAEQIAKNLLEKVYVRHHPEVFWKEVLGKVGVSV